MDTFVIITPAEIEHQEYGVIKVEIIHTFRADSIRELAIEKLNKEWEHESFYSEKHGYLEEDDVERVRKREDFDVYRVEDDEELELSDEELDLFYETLEEEAD